MCSCSKCGSNNIVQEHHIIKRGQAKFLINCKLNLIKLCWEHHHGTCGVHGKLGSELDLELKRELQNKLTNVFKGKEFFSEADIKNKLGINERDVRMLIKLLNYDIRGFPREEIIRACMGGKLVE